MTVNEHGMHGLDQHYIPNQGILFVNHKLKNRSGHLGHALVQCANGDLLAFYPNCSDDNDGHSAIGWMEYKRSCDYGKSWGPSSILPYSKQLLNSYGNKSAMSEKAVVTKKGSLLLFQLICDISENALWEPYWIPVYLTSQDQGVTWEYAKELGKGRGRVYDALSRDNTIYVLKFCNDAIIHWTGNLPNHQYKLYTSDDNGQNFTIRSILPFDTNGRGYGTLCFLKNGDLIAYCYNSSDEYHSDYVISHDMGYTWEEPEQSFFSKKLRNPQMVQYGYGYLMHGRSGNHGEESGHFILYYSSDGIRWDDGRYLCRCSAGYGAYSNNLVVEIPTSHSRRLLIHSSHAYEKNKTNILSWWIDMILTGDES